MIARGTTLTLFFTLPFDCSNIDILNICLGEQRLASEIIETIVGELLKDGVLE